MDEKTLTDLCAYPIPVNSYELDGVGVEKWIITHDPQKEKWIRFKINKKVWADSIENLLKQIIVN